MDTSILAHSPRIWHQPSFYSVEDGWSDQMDKIPFMRPAFFIRWEELFSSIKDAYYQGLYDLSRREQEARKQRMLGNQTTFEFVDSFQEKEVNFSRESFAGRKPTRFYPLFRAFILAPLLYIEVMDESVFEQVRSNPYFKAACGFKNVPGCRVFSRFDQVMRENGLWHKAKQIMAENNISLESIAQDTAISVDITHVEAEATYGKEVKTCDHQDDCECPKVLTDDNVGIVRKSNTVTYIGHKVAVVSGAQSEIPYSRFVIHGSTNDAVTLKETLETFCQEWPSLTGNIDHVLADGVYQTKDNQNICQDTMEAKLVSPIHPRGHKDKKVDARGIDHIDKYGNPHCISGHKMIYEGADQQKEQYIWRCPKLHPRKGDPTLPCPLANHHTCCDQSLQGRVFRINQSSTPQVDPDLPQHGITFKQLYKLRTGAERIFGILKDGYSFRRVHKRGKKAVEAHVDRCLLSMHIMIAASVEKTGIASKGWRPT